METPAGNPRPSLVLMVIVGLIPLAFAAFGAFLLIAAWPKVIEGWTASAWPEAAGRVVEARMPKVERESTGPGSKTWYELQLSYDFEAGGRTHRGDRTGLWPESRQLVDAREFVAAHPPGTAVRVFHDPANPTRSLLDRSIGGGTWAMAIGGLPSLALGVVMLIGFSRAVRRG